MSNKKASSAPKQKFELNAAAIAALRAALADDPEKLQRLEERLERSREQAARRTALERKIALLKSRNAALRAAAQPPPAPPPLSQQQQPLAPDLAADVLDDLALISVTSSTSPGYTVSSHDSTLTRAALDRTTRGPSPSTPSAATAAATPTTTTTVTAAAAAAGLRASRQSTYSSTGSATSQAAVDEFDENTIRNDTAPVPDTWGSQKSIFRYVGPTVKGMVSTVIPDGVLYRIITDKGEWVFYNDTRYYVAQVRYRLLGGSAVTPGPTVTVTPVSGGSSSSSSNASQDLYMDVGPEETKVLLKGRVVDFENTSAATLLPRRAATAGEEHLLSKEPQRDWKVIAAAYPPAAGVSANSSSSALRAALDAEALLAYCMEQHIRFVDPAFFPCHASLYRSGKDAFFIAPLHWRSPFRYLPDDEKVRREVRLFRGPRLNPDGLHAGHNFPDAAFLACVTGLACHWPQQLRQVFVHPVSVVEGRRERAVNAFRVSLCRGGWWESVVVDGFLPASATCPEFSRCADDLRLLWLPLLQKACAKFYHSYAASLNAPMEGLVGLLTGGPCCTLRELWPSREDLRVNSPKATRFFATLKRLLRVPSPSASASASTHASSLCYLCWLRPYSLTTARAQDTRDKLERLYADVGLAPGTAVVVLGLETLEDGHCVVRLRQTAAVRQSADAWLEVWRAAKKPWVDSVSDLVFALDDAEGTVWMGLEDVPQYFQSGYLTPLTADWATVKARGNFTKRRPSLALQVEVAATTRVLVTVTQSEIDSEGVKQPLLNAAGAAGAVSSASSTVKDAGEAVKTEGALAGLSCFVFSKGTEDALQFVGSNSDTADVFELSNAPHFTYERDVCVGLVLEPQNGPYVFVPGVHVNSADVSYTITVQARSEASSARATTPRETDLSVHFVEVKLDAAVLQSHSKPTLRQSSIESYSSPLEHQVCPVNSRRLVHGQGSSVNLAL